MKKPTHKKHHAHYSASLAASFICTYICQRGLPHANPAFHDHKAKIEAYAPNIAENASVLMTELLAQDGAIPNPIVYAAIYHQIQDCLGEIASNG